MRFLTGKSADFDEKASFVNPMMSICESDVSDRPSGQSGPLYKSITYVSKCAFYDGLFTDGSLTACHSG